MSYDFSAFRGNVIQLTAKETFPPELPVFVRCRAGAHAAGTERCQPGTRWQCPMATLPRGKHGRR